MASVCAALASINDLTFCPALIGRVQLRVGHVNPASFAATGQSDLITKGCYTTGRKCSGIKL